MAADPTYDAQANVYINQGGAAKPSVLVVNATAGGMITPANQTQATAPGSLTISTTETISDAIVTTASTSDSNVADTVLVDTAIGNLGTKVNLIITALTNVGILAST